MTAKPGRDHLLDHTLKHGLSSAAAWGQESECLDAETLAAWVDGGLERHQAALTEAHLSNCGQCQELLAALAQALPPAAGQNRNPAPAGRWWLVPLMAAAAVALWMVMPAPFNFTSPSEPAAKFAQAAPPEPIPAPMPAPTTPPAAQAAPAASAPATPAPEVTRPAPQPAPERDRAEKFREPTPPPAARVMADRTPPVIPPAPANPPAPVPVPQPALAEAVTPRPASPPPAAAPPAPVPLGQVVSPDRRFRWRYSAAGLDHTTDGGATWEQVSEAIGRFVTAGTAPSATVCWLVARGGGVFVTDDGRTFFRARFPEIVNLVGVSATSRAAATVTTDDGRTFVTSDGGVSWRQQ